MQVFSGPPTFQWQKSVYTNLTYDVAVFDVVWLNQLWVPGKRLEYVQGWTNSTYTMSKGLPPGEYCWGVRQREGDQVWSWQQHQGRALGMLIVPIRKKGSFARFRVKE
jgi:hypothetical protein